MPMDARFSNTRLSAFTKAHVHRHRAYQWSQQASCGQGSNRDARPNIADFGFSGIDHSTVGGEDAWLHLQESEQTFEANVPRAVSLMSVFG
jgi:hypothetical protein